MELCFDAMGKQGLLPSIDTSSYSISRAKLQMFHQSNGCLGIAENCHHLHARSLYFCSLLDHHIEGKSDRTQLWITDLYASSNQNAVAGPRFSSWMKCYCGSHSTIIGARSIGPPDSDPWAGICFFLISCAARICWPHFCCPV